MTTFKNYIIIFLVLVVVILAAPIALAQTFANGTNIAWYKNEMIWHQSLNLTQKDKDRLMLSDDRIYMRAGEGRANTNLAALFGYVSLVLNLILIIYIGMKRL